MEINHDPPQRPAGGAVISADVPHFPEGVALALMRDIEAAEENAGRRDRRSNQSERERLLDLYRQCLGVVTRSGPRRCTDPAAPNSPARRQSGNAQRPAKVLSSRILFRYGRLLFASCDPERTALGFTVLSQGKTSEVQKTSEVRRDIV